MRSISVFDLRDWRASGKGFVLLDVREAVERAIAPFPDSVNVPMRDVPARMNELPHDQPLVVLCHYGERSARVARFLDGNGFDRVYNLDGGIDAYSESVDAGIPRY